MVLAAVQRVQRANPKARAGPFKPRANTPPRDSPPRDPKDNKCANCNDKGHDASKFPKAKVLMSERRCHTCNRTGHLARNCPDKDKKAITGGQARLAIQDGAMKVMVITDDEGVRQVGHRPSPKGTLISELPVRQTGGNQATRRNRFAPLLCSGYPQTDCRQACCESRSESDSGEQDLGAAPISHQPAAASSDGHGRVASANGTFNSQAKATGSQEREKNKRGSTYSKRKEDPRGRTSPDEDLD